MRRITFNRNKFQLPPGSRWRKMLFWDVTLGCSPTSIGCKICSSARRIGEKDPTNRLITQSCCDRTFHFNGTVELHEDRLKDVTTFKEKEQVFVCGRSDLFHYEVPSDFIAKIFEAAASRPDCTFFAITKRAERMAKVCSRLVVPDNFWLSVSVENQEMAARRIPCLANLKTRIISAKPLLGPLDLKPFADMFDMVIVGGEYGRGARPMFPEWPRSIRDQCLELGKPFSFHNWGLWVPGPGMNTKWVMPTGELRWTLLDAEVPGSVAMHRHENETSGYQLDGKIWDQYPCGK